MVKLIIILFVVFALFQNVSVVSAQEDNKQWLEEAQKKGINIDLYWKNLSDDHRKSLTPTPTLTSIPTTTSIETSEDNQEQVSTPSAIPTIIIDPSTTPLPVEETVKQEETKPKYQSDDPEVNVFLAKLYTLFLSFFK